MVSWVSADSSKYIVRMCFPSSAEARAAGAAALPAAAEEEEGGGGEAEAGGAYGPQGKGAG